MPATDTTALASTSAPQTNTTTNPILSTALAEDHRHRPCARQTGSVGKDSSNCGVLRGITPVRKAYDFPIRNIWVLQTGHDPRVAGLPFFMVMA